MADYNDPFANTPPAPAPQQAPAATNEGPWSDSTSQVGSSAQRPNLSEEGYGVSVTFKYSGKYEDPWLVLRTATVEEMDQLLTGPPAQVLARLVDRVSEVARSAERVHTNRAPVPPAGTYGQPAGAATPPTPPPATPANTGANAGNGAPMCQHGQRVFKADKNHNPPEWQAWMCPARRDDPTKCKPQYL